MRFARTIAAAGMLVLAVVAGTAHADWRKAYPELTFAVVPAENADGVLQRYEPMMAYMAKELGVPVKLRVVNDYAAVIEGLRTGQVHYAHLGPAAYARAQIVTKGGVEPMVTVVNSEGVIGYFSVLYVRANDAAQKLDDLKGRNLCLVDPNSASGNNVPRHAMDKRGIDPESFFAKVVYSGSHENAVIALQQGTCDGAFNWWNTEIESNLQRMAAKKMVKPEDFRIVFKSDLIPGSPTVVIAAAPAEMKAAIRQALMDAPVKGKDAFLRLSDGKATGYAAVKADDYKVMIELVEFVDRMRKKAK